MFRNNSDFTSWIKAYGPAGLADKMMALEAPALQQVREVFNKHSSLNGSSDLGDASTQLGKAIAHLMKAIDKAPGFASGADKKAFVMDSSIAHFRLLDQGIKGDSAHFMHEHRAHLPQMFPNGPEADLVSPLADQAVEKCYEIMQRMKDV